MKDKTKIIGAVVLLVVLLALVINSLLSIQNTGLAVLDKPVKVGVILPLSGDFTVLGEEIMRGIELGMDEISNEELYFEIIYEDDQSLSPVASVNAANKLININNIDLGLTMLVEESEPIANIFNENEVPLVVLWDSNELIGSGEYLFSNGFSTEKAGESMAEYAYSELRLREIAILKHLDPWAEIISDSFKGEFESMGGEIIYEEELFVGETDYRTSILKIKEAGPDSVYFPMVPMNSLEFITQAKELDLNIPLLTGDALLQDVIDLAGGAAEGIYFTNIYTDDADLLIEKYRRKYNQDPLDITVVSFGYDGVFLLKEAEEISEEKGISYKDSLVMILGEDHSKDRVEKIFKVVDGRPVERE